LFFPDRKLIPYSEMKNHWRIPFEKLSESLKEMFVIRRKKIKKMTHLLIFLLRKMKQILQIRKKIIIRQKHKPTNFPKHKPTDFPIINKINTIITNTSDTNTNTKSIIITTTSTMKIKMRIKAIKLKVNST
jgi:hypothetical protein